MKAVLYIHGKNGCGKEVEQFKDIFSSCGYSVFFLDLPGHGDSSLPLDDFNPWKSKPVILGKIAEIRKSFEDLTVVCNSIGCYFFMNALSSIDRDGDSDFGVCFDIRRVFLISPICDMKILIENMMHFSNVTAAELEDRQEIETSFGETLSWKYYSYVLENPIDFSALKNKIERFHVLYGRKDVMTDFDTVAGFLEKIESVAEKTKDSNSADANRVTLKIMEDGEHWFHTDGQICFLRNWIKEILSDEKAEYFAKKCKCVITDLDRTFLHNDGKISDCSKKAAEKLIEKGIVFAAASGRAFNSLPEDLFEINGIKYAVTSNGVSVDDIQKGKSLGSCNIHSEAIFKLFEYLKNENVMYECFIEGQGYTGQKYYDNPMIFGGAKYKTEYIRRTRKPVEDIKQFILDHINEIQCIDVLLSSEDRSRILSGIRENFSELYATSGENFLIEIMSKECGKHRGMDRLCRILGISKDEVIAFGDGENDCEMLAEAGFGIAVQNACENAKNSAAKVSSFTNDEDAVAREIEEMFF